MKLLFVTRLDRFAGRMFTLKWRSERMKLLLVSKVDRSARAVSTITKYVQVGKALGHEVAVFGESQSEFPSLNWSLDVKRFDFAIFVVYDARDFPDLPYLAQLLDSVPKERRVIIDCCGRYNETIRVDHDFNHLEKLDGHQGWEWLEGFQAVSDKIFQPTLTPLRPDVRSFLFHGFDQTATPRGRSGAATPAGSGSDNGAKPYGVVYVGNNWQRWTQMARFLEAVEPLRERLGRICLTGWDWDKQPDWAIQLGVHGADVDPELLKRLEVETRWAVPFNEVADLVGQGRFCPVFHRPLFNQLGLVTNRTFETFTYDTIPLLMIPDDLVESIYGVEAKPLAPADDVAGRLEDMLRRPESYEEAVAKTRAHLTQHHSYERRFAELQTLLES